MGKTLSTQNQNASQARIIREQFIVDLGFSTPQRLSSRETLTWNSNSYTGADMRGSSIDLDGKSGALRIHDEDYALVPYFISEGTAGITVTVRQLYGESPYGLSDADVLFTGELGAWVENDNVISVRMIEPQVLYFPNIYINAENGFNHLPPKGTRFSTPDGIIEFD